NVLDFGIERQNISSTSDEILANTDSAIIATDIKGIIVQANKQACKIFNYPENELLGLEVHLILPPHLREAHKLHFTGFVESDKTEMVLGERGEITGYRKDGSFFPAEASIAKIESNDGVLLVATLRDISGRKKQEDDLLWRATHDPLTGLPNRSLIKDRLNNALARSERTGNMVVLMFIDLDQFKIVNDSYGHDAGDDLLVAISNRLVEVVRPGDTVARFGGDEFIVLCDQITDENIVTQLVERIIENVKTPVEIEDSIFYPTVSIGIVGGYGSEMTAEQMLQNADTAMYIAKDQGRDGWKVYDDDIGESTRNHLRIANGLRQAVERNQLEAYYQPIVDVESHEIVGSETLLRWKYEGEMISPAIFIPIAEMTGSIVELGYWVFEASCKQQTELRKHFSDEELPYISINLSARQLTQYNLIERFESIIEKHNVSVKHLVIEITESTLMIDIERSLKLLHGLGDIGLSLAIDDFGTGHSSLSRIKSLPVDTIKVDQTFIRHIHKDSGNQAITKAVIEMAHALGLKVTAEGVEEIAELNVLKDLHCNRVQGYLFDKPLTADQFMVALLNHKQGYQLAG
ncbi:MAG: EAL domain-containing protein, partial [Gammaproteobacteria bacterium]|nr:EAL domain-containing protein [Gammaproteobacteria bacterium]